MTMQDILTVRSEETGALITVVASGEVDLETGPRLRDELLRHLTPGARVRLHLAGVTFMDSSGLHVLIASKRRAGLLGADFGVVEPSHQVRRLLQVSGLEALLMAAPEPSAQVATH